MSTWAGTACAQGLIVHAMTGQPVAGGLEGEVYTWFPNGYGSGGSLRTIPRINNGHVVFRANTNRSNAAGTTPIFAGVVGHAVPVFRFSGDSGIPGVQFGPLQHALTSPLLRIMPSGEVGLVATLQGNGIHARNDEVVVIGTSGNWRIAAREGEQALGEQEGMLLSSYPSHTSWNELLAHWSMSNTGQMAAHTYITRPGLPIGDLWGMIADPNGEPEVVARRSLGGFGGGTVFGGWPMHQFRGAPSMNSVGTVAMYATFDVTQPIRVGTDTHGIAVFEGGQRVLSLRNGDDAPDLPGTRMTLGINHYQNMFMGISPALNDAGNIAASVSLWNNSDQSVGTGIILVTEHGRQFVAKTGDAKPGSEGGTFGVNDLLESRTVLSGSGAVAFADQSRRGVYVGTSPSDLRLAFDPLSSIWPGGLGQPLVITDTIGINVSNQLVAALTFATSPTTTAIAGWDPVAGDILIAYTGQTIEVLPGVYRTIRTLDFNGLDGVFSGGGEDGRPNALDNAGRVVFTAHFTNNESAVLVATIPSPASVGTVLLGLFAMRRRR